MQWPILGPPIPNGKAIATSGWASPRTVGSSSGIHGALDFSLPKGTPVIAIADGRVLEAMAIERTYTGKYVLLEHTFPGGLRLLSRSIHLDTVVPLAKGQLVQKGQQIGTVGSTGSSSYSNHLHLDVRVCGATALADYKATFGWPKTTLLPALVSTPGCTPVPAEPLVWVDGYRAVVEKEAKEQGIPLARNRSVQPAASSAGGAGVVALIVGAIVIGSGVAAWWWWKSQKHA